MSRMLTLTVSGGYHNVKPKNFKIPEDLDHCESFSHLLCVIYDRAYCRDQETSRIMERTYNRIVKHTCGVPGCQCGGDKNVKMVITY